jgi:hypothetical protein
MRRRAIVILAAVTAGAFPTPAQKANPFSGEVRQMYDRVKNNLINMAEKMPPENYNFKPMAETRTFGQNEEYGYMAVCLRLKGIVPPSSVAAESR